MKKLEALKDCNEKLRRPFTEWEKKFANDVTNKGIISKYTNSSYRALSNKQPNQKMSRSK